MDLNELLPEIVDFISPPQNIKVCIQSGLPVLFNNRTCIHQVFQNIISNAIKYQPLGNKPQISVKSIEYDDYWIVSIKDNGIGMPENVRKRIFEPFYTTKEVGEGTGLGLSISFGIIENHKGSISVKSEQNNGSEFIIRLPISLS